MKQTKEISEIQTVRRDRENLSIYNYFSMILAGELNEQCVVVKDSLLYL